MAEKIRRLRSLAGVASRPRWVSASRAPMWRRFYNSTNPKRAQELPKPLSPVTGTDGRTLNLVVAVVAGLAGYGISRLPGDDANSSKSVAAILDPERIHTVKYATLEGMKRVNLTPPLVYTAATRAKS